MKSKTYLFIVTFFFLFFISCDDDIVDSSSSSEGNILVTTILPNPDGMSGSAYMQLISNIEPAALTNATSIPIPYSSVPCVCDNDIYVIPGWGAESDEIVKYSRSEGELVKQGEYTLPAQSGATNVVTKGDLAFVACAFLGKILVVNHNTMEKVTEIDISSYGYEDQNPDPSSMLIRDNYLYVAVSQMVGGYFPASDRPYSDVIIINIDNYQVVKMITESASGISTPTRPIDPNSIFLDENNNIYVVCLGAWGALPGHKSGILRINSGETEFDENYKFVLNDTPITGEDNPLDYILSVRYAGNNICYGTLNIPAYYGNPINYVTDRTVITVEIDLVAKTIKRLDFPYSNSFGVAVGKYENNIVFGLATENANGYYTYNMSSGEASQSVVITTEGYPSTFTYFE